MNERVSKLRQRSIDTEPYVSTERAVLITECSKKNEFVSVPVQRAHIFRYLMENKEICIIDGELIVGERGPALKATPTYPEICCHSIEDLNILNNREKVRFEVSEEAQQIYQDTIIPFWKGKTIREKIFSEMTENWKLAYQSGIFTEFMEQRAPGHTALDDKIYHQGLLDFKEKIQKSLSDLDFFDDPESYRKQEELEAMSICADAVITLAQRYVEKIDKLRSKEKDPKRKGELKKIKEVCQRVPAYAPRTFWESIQYYWFVHLAVITELNPWDAFNPGRLDQHLYPFYKRDLEKGVLSREQAKELLQCLWIKFHNHPAPPKVGITAQESATYTDFANINTGGLKTDGKDGVNELTYLLLEVIDEMKLVQPSTNIQLSQKNPDEFLKRACKIIRKGWGQPAVFNADAVVEELLRQGKSIADARNGGTSGCVETGAFGKESYILTGYLNLPKILEITLNRGIDPKTKNQIGLDTGDPLQFESFDDVMNAFQKQLNHFVDIKIRGNNVIERIYAEYMPTPFLSILIDDCITRGKDYNDGGARYNTNYIQGVGIGTVTDSLLTIKYHVFDFQNLSMKDLLEALSVDFSGFEKIRDILLNKTPKYGNDEEYADLVMVSVFELYYEAVNGRKNTKGGKYCINLLPTTCHIYFGSVTGASTDGRKAWQPLSEGISPVQGSDRQGPTGVFKSAAKMDHIRTGGTLLNQKFTPQLLENEKGINSLAHLVRGYFKLGGHHIQFNIIDADTLREAQNNPDLYSDLIIRVAGYSDYFCELSKSLQDEIISRTEHQRF